MDVAHIADNLPEPWRKAITRAGDVKGPHGKPVHHRAGDLFFGQGQIAAASWLKTSPLFERYFHSGYLAYRLTPLGLAVRAYLANPTIPETDTEAA